LIFAALAEAAERDELLLVEGGMCRFHRRQDGTVTIREILVLPRHRRLGVARRMIEEVQRRNPGARLAARCPPTDSAGRVGAGNVFWHRLGFTRGNTSADGINTWTRAPG
jgi:GNAT superfamily N-acetyltransferase